MTEDCRACGAAPARTWLGGEGPSCDGCFDERISAATGWPRLPVPPNPMVVPDPKGREHRFRVRLSRSPGGISAEAFEDRPDSDNDDGYQLSVFGEHDADPEQLLAQLERRVRAEVGRRYLEHDQGRWHVAEHEVAGRVDHSEAGPPDVLVDGRRLSWDELGHIVASFEGWWFRLRFGDDEPIPPARNGLAVVVPLRPPPPG